MYSVATVQKVATSVIMIECGDGSYANYLADQWPKLPNWCGLLPTPGPVEVHGQKVVIAMACGGKFKPEDIPKRNVSGVKSFPNTGDFHIARQWLLPNHGNGHSRTQANPVILFGGKN